MMKLNFKLKLLIFAIAALLVFCACSANTSDDPKVVQPDGSYCLDKTGKISESTKEYIAERNHNLEDNCAGAQICVVVVNSTNGEKIYDYGYAVFNSWKIGSSEYNNGALITLSIGDGTYWITPGYGLENNLTFDVTYDLLEAHCKPDFEKKDFDSAVRKTFDSVNELICSKYGADPAGSSAESSSFYGSGGDAIPGLNASCADISGLACSCACSRACSSCASCASCAACLGCGSCTGVGLIILVLIIIYVVMQVLRGMGKGASRSSTPRGGSSGPANHSGPGSSFRSGASGTGSFSRTSSSGAGSAFRTGASGTGSAFRSGASGTNSSFRTGASGTGFRPRAWMFAVPMAMKAVRRATRSGLGGSFRGFTGSPFNGTVRRPNPGSGFGGFSGFKGTPGSGSGFRGFSGGGGGSRGGGGGKR